MKKYFLLLIVCLMSFVCCTSSQAQSLRALDSISGNYFAKQKYDSSLIFAEKALSLAEKKFGKSDTNYLNYLMQVGNINLKIKSYTKNISLLEPALKPFTKPTDKTMLWQDATSILAISFQGNKEFPKAEELFLTVKNLRKEKQGDKSRNYVQSLQDLNSLYKQSGQTEKQEAVLKELISIVSVTAGKEHPFYLGIVHDLASLYFETGIYAKAEMLFKEVCEAKKKTLGTDNMDYGQSVNSLAALYGKMGLYIKAEPMFIEAIRVRKKALGETNPDYAMSVVNLGVLYTETGQYEKAEPLLLDAKKIIYNARGKNDYLYASVINSLAGLYSQMGQYERAEPLFIEAKNIRKELLGEKNADYATDLNNLGMIYYEMEDYTKAEPILVEAKNIRKDALGANHPDYAESLNNLAMVYEKTGRYAKAEPLLIEAKDILKTALGDHPSYATSLNYLAVLYSRTGEYKKAEPLFIEAKNIIIKTLGEKHPLYADLLSYQAFLYDKMGQFATAETLYVENSKVRLLNIQQNFSFLSEREKSDFLTTSIDDFNSFIGFAIRRVRANPAITKQVSNNLLVTKGILLSSRLQVQNSILKSRDTVLIKLYRDWEAQKKYLGQLQQMREGSATKMGYNLDSLENVTNTMEKELCKRSADFDSDLKIQNTTWQDVQKNLSKTDAAVEFLTYTSSPPEKFDSLNRNISGPDTVWYCALIVRPGYDAPRLIRLFEETQLTDILNQMVNSRGVQVLDQPATKEKNMELYDLIWKPIDSLLTGAKTVFFSPSGLLYRASFAAFANADMKFLFDRYNLIMMSCTRSIGKSDFSLKVTPGFNSVIYGGIEYTLEPAKQLEEANMYKTAHDALLAMNDNPNFKVSTRGGAWKYLKGTLTEANSISEALLKNKIPTQLYIGKQAVEEAFKSLSGKSPSVIHIATHGFYFSGDAAKKNSAEKEVKFLDNPLFRSGLIMAGANRVWTGNASIEGIDDGILTAYEVSLLDLSNTKLVVLSACETGLGDLKDNEGVYGLQRAFKLAGVDYLIVTLWEIRDEVTVEFMNCFYSQWLKGKDIHAAFKYAQDEMRKKYEANYWAAFVLLN